MTNLGEIWQSFGVLQGNIIAAIVTITVPIAGYYLQPSVRLRWGRANVSFHNMKKGDAPLTVNVEKHYLQNTGRKTAHTVQFVFNHEPGEVSIWPPRNYSTSRTPEGNFVLNIPQIAPKEFLIIDSIYVNIPHAQILSVVSADCIGKQVEYRVLRHFGNVFNVSFLVLSLFGFFYAAKLVAEHFLK